MRFTGNYSDEIKKLKKAIEEADAVYACVNFGEAVCSEDIMAQAICIDGDIGTVIDELRM